MMTAVLGALPFLAILWLLLVLAAASFEESGSKIAAALKGEPVNPGLRPSAGRRDRTHARSVDTSRVKPKLRAAA